MSLGSEISSREEPGALQEALAPLTLSDLAGLLRERRIAHFRTGRPDRFHGLLTWPRVRQLLSEGHHPRSLGEFRVIRESASAPPHLYLSRDPGSDTNRVDVEKLDGLLDQGYALAVTPIEHHVPKLAQICGELTRRLAEKTKVGLIANKGSDGAFKLHYDPEDILILQVQGAKRWQIFGPSFPNPIIDLGKQIPPENPVLLLDITLLPGEMLFVPAGFWHHCRCGDELSLHLGIMFIPQTAWDAIKLLISDLKLQEELRIPLTRQTPQDLARIQAAAQQAVMDKARQLTVIAAEPGAKTGEPANVPMSCSVPQ